MKSILLTLIATLITAASSCGQEEVGLQSDHTEATVDEMTAEATTVTETIESSNVPETATETETLESATIIEYNDVELQDIIDRNIDTLTQMSSSSFTTEDCIAAHPDAFEAIVSLGKRAIPFLRKYTDSDYGHDCSMARAAAYAIDPSLYDLVFESPDKSTSIKLSVRSFDEDVISRPRVNYGKLSLITDSDIIELGEFDCASAEVSWSDSGNYAVLTGISNNLCVSSDALLIDISNQKSTELPSLEIYNRILADEPELMMILSFSLKNCDWSSDKLTIGFELEVGAAFYPQIIHGEYTFDIKTNEFVDLKYDPLPNNSQDTDLTGEEIMKIVDENLDILINSNERFYSEEEFISANPESFAEIVNLGEAALPYLEQLSIAEPMNTYRMFTGEISKGMAARIVAYAIKQSLYDVIYTSPDNAYTLRLGVSSFLHMGWGSTIMTAYNQVDIISCADNHTIFAYDVNQRYYGPYTNVSVEWSPDSAYIAIQSSDQKKYLVTDIYDVKGLALIELPSIQELILTMIMPESDASEYDNLYAIDYSVDSWSVDGKVKIKYFFMIGHFEGGQGYYEYDLTTHDISSVEYTALNF